MLIGGDYLVLRFQLNHHAPDMGAGAFLPCQKRAVRRREGLSLIGLKARAWSRTLTMSGASNMALVEIRYSNLLARKPWLLLNLVPCTTVIPVLTGW